MEQNRISNPLPLLRRRPQAVAEVRGSVDYPTIRGWVRFYQTRQGVLVAAEVMGLPVPAQNCHSPIFGFHIHEGEQCTGNAKDRFADAKMHFNPDECPHPYHAGDLPPLFGNHGFAWMAVLTDRFTLNEVLGRTVIIHSSVDDFTSQPSGNSGTKMACGVIRRV